jgi:hypothetical protein
MYNRTGYIAMLALAMGGIIGGAVRSSAATISGHVTGPGGAAVEGALVRTEGQPVYSTLTGSDGSYSLTVPAGNFVVLASGQGYAPKRLALPALNSSSTAVRDFSLRTADSGSVVNLPAPLDWGEPPSAPAPPGDSFSAAFADTGSLPAVGAPVISEYNEIVKPDETFTMTGVDFSTRTGADEGTDTTVWVCGATSGGTNALRQARIWRATNNSIVATLPDDIPFGMYLVWVENNLGVSAPICLNRTTPKWVGPMGSTADPGATKRVFGRNMSYDHGTTTSYVHIQPAGGGEFTSCAVTKVDPYSVEFTVPSDTPLGSYKVFVHNGHGGAYGWGDALDLVVTAPWVRGSAEVTLSPSGGDDTVAIRNAVNSMASQPGGGTVKLSAGDFTISGSIELKAKVALRGAGINATNLQLKGTGSWGSALYASGDYVAISDMTMHEFAGSFVRPNNMITLTDTSWTGVNEFTSLKSVRVIADNSPIDYRRTGQMVGALCEVSDCEFYRELDMVGDSWAHDNTFYGDFYYSSESGAALHGERNVFEYNHCETKSWPVGPNSNRNYSEFLTWDQICSLVWCKRVALTYTSQSYVANNTAKDVAVQQGKGEMLLYHTFPAQWWGQVLSNTGLTLTLRTDGKIDDQVMSIDNYDTTLPPLVGGGATIPNSWQWWTGGAPRHAVIIAGRGIGQARRVTDSGITSNTLTVERPWRVAPDATSKIIFTGQYNGNMVYNNDFNAFPLNYVHTWTASCLVQFDGSAQKNFVEGDTSRRTESGRSIWGWSGGPNSWNEMRNETAIDCNSGTFEFRHEQANPLGPTLIGNAYRDCQGNVVGTPITGAIGGYGLGTVYEKVSITSRIGCVLAGAYNNAEGTWPDGLVMYRNGTVTVQDSPLQPVYISKADGKQFLVNNQYVGNSQAYWYRSGLSGYVIPVPLQRVAKFSCYAGGTAPDVVVPVVNAGTNPMSWSVAASDPWITATVAANASLSPESTAGRVVIAANTTAMSAGRYWGYVTVTSGAASVRIGVCVDVLAGSPANTPPNAIFTATPSVGAAPREVTFSATGSNDLDGLIASYYWDFGDGTYGSGVSTTHIYGQGTFIPVLTVTDTQGATDQAWSTVTVSPELTAVSLTGTPVAPIDAGTAVTLTATPTGGYLPLYRFLIRSGAGGWTVLRDYQTTPTCAWTPSASGYYEIKVEARSSDSLRSYDTTSNVIAYPVGLVPVSGMKLWLKADDGVSKDVDGNVLSWSDRSGSGNHVAQSDPDRRPVYTSDVVNGRPSVRFGGGGEMLESSGLVLSGATNFTTFAAVKFNEIPAGTYQYLWWNGIETSTSGYGSWISTVPKIKCGWGNTDKAVTALNSVIVGDWYTVSSRYAGATHQTWINGVSQGQTTKTGANYSSGFFSLGNFGPSAYQGFCGDVAEVFIYNRNLSDAEKANVESYLSAKWSPIAPVTVDRLKDVKALGNSVLVTIPSAKVAVAASGVFSDGSAYVVEQDRTCGLKITGAVSIALWDNLILSGTTDTDQFTGEKVLRVATVSKVAGSELNSLGFNGKTFSPSGQFVRVWGKVTARTSTYLTIDDGSGSPVRVQTDGLVTPLSTVPNVGQYISATGPAGLMAGGVPAVRVRSASDIRVY